MLGQTQKALAQQQHANKKLNQMLSSPLLALAKFFRSIGKVISKLPAKINPNSTTWRRVADLENNNIKLQLEQDTLTKEYEKLLSTLTHKLPAATGSTSSSSSPLSNNCSPLLGSSDKHPNIADSSSSTESTPSSTSSTAASKPFLYSHSRRAQELGAELNRLRHEFHTTLSKELQQRGLPIPAATALSSFSTQRSTPYQDQVQGSKSTQ